MTDRGTALFVITPGLGSSPTIITISLDSPSSCVGGSGGFSDVPKAMGGDPYSAVVNFMPSGSSAIEIGGLFGTAFIVALVSVPTGTSISGSVTLNAALPNNLSIQTGTGGSYTLPAGQTSGNFNFTFDATQTISAAKAAGPPSANQ